MVSYWKTADSIEAKVMRAPEGHYVMQMAGEKYPFQGYPRGALLFGKLSPLKHQIKNKLFNETWAKLDAGVPDSQILKELRISLKEILTLAEETKYDQVPYEKMMPCVKEIWRALTAVEDGNQTVRKVKEMLCFILQEDDAYRFRVQWIVKFFPKLLQRWWKPTIRHFDLGLSMLEHAEMVGDMKERQRLLRRVLTFILKDPAVRSRLDRFLKEVDWSKVKLTEADKYFLRAKYFKCDFPEYQY